MKCECRQFPHHSRCPQADEPEVVGDCEICGYEIYEDAKYVKFGEELYCFDCIDACTIYPDNT